MIKKDIDQITLENPGSIRTGKNQILKGGISNSRNNALMKKFNIIGTGERVSNGVLSILQTWSTQGWNPPQVEEQYGPDRTRLTLTLTNIGGQDVRQESMDDKIEKLIRNNPSITAKEMAEHLKVNEKTIRRHIKNGPYQLYRPGIKWSLGNH